MAFGDEDVSGRLSSGGRSLPDMDAARPRNAWEPT
jgi:hypothetical protein